VRIALFVFFFGCVDGYKLGGLLSTLELLASLLH
jgi:hypothetical protein